MTEEIYSFEGKDLEVYFLEGRDFYASITSEDGEYGFIEVLKEKKEIENPDGNKIDYDLILGFNPGRWYTQTSNYLFFKGKPTKVENVTHSSLENIGIRYFNKISSIETKYLKPLTKYAENKLGRILISDETWEELEKGVK